MEGGPLSCWSHKSFGDPLDHNGSSWELSPSQCAATQTIWGGSGMDIKRASDKLHRCADEKGLKILAVGGSITTGHSQSRLKGALAGPNGAWPSQLQKYLNSEHPCPNSEIKHVVLNRSTRSVGSDHWLQYFLTSRNNEDHEVHDVDIILLETASNDFQSWHKGESEVTKYVELIIRTLRGLKHRPFFMWVTVGWRNAKDLTHGDTEEQHLKVMKYYDVPHTSMLGAFMPVENDSIMGNFLHNIYYGTDIRSHPTLFGHRLAGSVIGSRLSRQLNPSYYETSPGPDKRSWFIDSRTPPSYTLPKAIGYGDKRGRNKGNAQWLKELEIVDNKICGHTCGIYMIDFRLPSFTMLFKGEKSKRKEYKVRDLIVHNEGWQFKEDVPGKPGLIAYDVGSQLFITIPSFSNGVFHIGFLKSYEKMGLASVEFLFVDTESAAGLSCDQIDVSTTSMKTALLSRTRIDTSWKYDVSLKDTDIFIVDIPGKNNPPGCLWVKIKVEETKDR
eukprot:CAMPEP_0194277420 /NCGR_PEP_ID=MMETSP0169-20130528/9757_1 /TAXON_ID=218684 /ORGANISM="Corethron pennatum, Strain L29A3" /LENGTH=500 /DNA_ID=CAMNT_0039021391 /DNA_START=307 /DNA_END=1805 /DNA_ORIENTATION=-